MSTWQLYSLAGQCLGTQLHPENVRSSRTKVPLTSRSPWSLGIALHQENFQTLGAGVERSRCDCSRVVLQLSPRLCSFINLRRCSSATTLVDMCLSVFCQCTAAFCRRPSPSFRQMGAETPVLLQATIGPSASTLGSVLFAASQTAPISLIYNVRSAEVRASSVGSAINCWAHHMLPLISPRMESSVHFSRFSLLGQRQLTFFIITISSHTYIRKA